MKLSSNTNNVRRSILSSSEVIFQSSQIISCTFLAIVLLIQTSICVAQLDENGYPIGYYKDDCKWHIDRNQYNIPAKGKLTFEKTKRELCAPPKPPKLPPYCDEEDYRYYKDENNFLWRLEHSEHSKEHGKDNLKFTRMDDNGKGSHETVIIPEEGENENSECFENKRQLDSGPERQTYNYFDLHEYYWRHALYDYYPHIFPFYDPKYKNCGKNYTDPPKVRQPGEPNDWDKQFDPERDTGVPENSVDISVIRSFDPNDIIGPSGFGEKQWVSVQEVLPYTIRFENDPNLATAPAQKVVVTVQFGDNLDISSFALGSFGFGNLNFTIPDDFSSYSQRINAVDSVGVYVDVAFGIDRKKGIATWVFESLDANTGLPTRDPFAGFLPVNDKSKHNGEGYVNFTVKPKPSAKTGEPINVFAEIIFDQNSPITTNTWKNTVDAGAPDSQILPNFTFVDSTTYNVVWSGTDDMHGSGIKDYTIYVSDTSDLITKWISNTSDSSALFHGEYGNSYKFYCISRDHVNNIEAMPNSFDALLSVERSITEIPLDVFPNPIDQSAYIKYTLTESVDLNLSILNMNGQVVQMLVNKSQSAGNYTIILDTKGMIPGTYICRIIAGTKSPFIQSSQRIMVK